MRRTPLVLAVALLAAAGCTEDTGGAVDVPGATAPLREGVTTTQPGDVKLVAALAGPDGTGTVSVLVQATAACLRPEALVLSDGAAMGHLHKGAAGADPIVVDFGSLRSSACGPIDAAARAALLADPSAHTVDLHTVANPSGGLRGALARES